MNAYSRTRYQAARLLLVGLAIACSPAPPQVPSEPGASSSQTRGERTKKNQEPEAKSTVQRPNLRQLTVLVEPVQPSILTKTLGELAKRYSGLGSEWAQAASKSFGSGALFIQNAASSEGIKAPRAFVVTNRHVLGFADLAKVRFPSLALELQGHVAWVDAAYDLAVLELVGPIPSQLAGFSLEAQLPHDQDEVIASGYPAIAGEPSYQVTRGYVSNEHVVLEDYGPLPYIQHTAPIDPGSSGGPLVSPAGTLLGINTLKLRQREGVGMAIPAKEVLEALQQAIQSTPLVARDACARLAAALSQTEPTLALLGMLSADLVMREGPSSLVWLGSDPVWRTRFVEDPAFVLAVAVSTRLWQNVAKQGRSRAVECRESPAQHEFTLATGDRTVSITLRLEQASFKLADAHLSGPSGHGLLETWAPRTRKQGWKPQLR